MEIQIQHLTEVPILCPINWISRNLSQGETPTSMQRVDLKVKSKCALQQEPERVNRNNLMSNRK